MESFMKRSLWLCILPLVFAGALGAQENGDGAEPLVSPKEVLVLNLEECTRLALERNPDFIMTRQEVQMKEAAAVAAYGRFFPSISFNTRVTMLDPGTIKEGEMDVGRFTGMQPGTLVVNTVENPLFTMGLSAAYPIPWIPFFSDGAFGMANAAHDLALKDLGVSKNKMKKAERDVKAEVTKSFYQLKLSEMMFALTKANDERLRAYHGVAQQNFYAGRISQYEYLRTQVQLANMQPELLRAENNTRLARVALLQKLFLDLDMDIRVVGDLQTEFIHIDEDEAFASARANRSELQDIAISIEVLKLQEKLATYGNRPQLAAFGNYNFELKRKANMIDYITGNIPDRKLNGSWNVGLQLSIPISELLNPASTAWKSAKQYEHGIERAETLRRNVESLIKLEIRRNVLLLEENHKTIEAQASALTLSTEGLRIARVAYGAGQISHVELMDAELDYQRAQLMEYQAWYGYITAKIDLRNAMGVL